MARHNAMIERAQNTESRHAKLDLQLKIVTSMITVCEEHHDEDGKSFWQWALNVLDLAGHDFMSDEETTSVLDTRVLSVPVKKVMLMKWRHPYFLRLFVFIDVTTGMEEEIFQKIGKAAFRRVRSQEETTWPPPCGRPKAFYALVYLSMLKAPQLAALKMTEEVFVLRSFDGYLNS
ncbi:hypothetical protein BDP27DRAFT_1458506 [Rhodocollybia butyracea]|uniref:Uncharacterized protein n=1 Tax=Rhodocollybia butyracea TaxID=206335 RepID=A0A9P5P3Y9_9AGAR|nr:hypothetical protein BDP27DRAFT_1458506 [Rhodocollybia butyracea]